MNGMESVETERLFKIEVLACNLSDADLDALFSRVADAAHALDEQVSCFGAIEVVSEP